MKHKSISKNIVFGVLAVVMLIISAFAFIPNTQNVVFAEGTITTLENTKWAFKSEDTLISAIKNFDFVENDGTDLSEYFIEGTYGYEKDWDIVVEFTSEYILHENDGNPLTTTGMQFSIEYMWEVEGYMVAMGFCERGILVPSDGMVIYRKDNNIDLVGEDGSALEMLGNSMKIVSGTDMGNASLISFIQSIATQVETETEEPSTGVVTDVVVPCAFALLLVAGVAVVLTNKKQNIV